MPEDSPVNVNVTTEQHQPWWLRVLEKQGIPTLFALVLLFGGWKIINNLGNGHLNFLEQQSKQMVLQSDSLKVISESALRQESLIRSLHEDTRKEAQNRAGEYRTMFELFKETHR